jgi:hypothetical protein
MTDLRERVFHNLDNSLENGYDMIAWDPAVVADDMLMYADHDFEAELVEYQDDPGYLEEEIAKFVKEWQAGRKENADMLGQ